jgi:DNA-binding NarL/FixJ family response regulator
LLRNGLSALVRQFGYEVVCEASDGIDLQQRINPLALPDIVLLDINMPRMDGFDTCRWLKQQYPSVRVVALSMYDDEAAVIRMIRAGARGYVLKDCEPMELAAALRSVSETGFHYSELLTGKIMHAVLQLDGGEDPSALVKGLTQRAIEFLKLAASDKTYKEIADEMGLSPRTVDGYRDELFEKLQVKSRVGLVIFAIKHRIVQV